MIKRWPLAPAARAAQAKPVTELLARRPQHAATLQAAIRASLPAAELRYLPLVRGKTLDWVALLDAQLNLVGWAPVDGF